MIIGYVRVSSQDQNLDLQLEAMRKAGCDKVTETRGRCHPKLEFQDIITIERVHSKSPIKISSSKSKSGVEKLFETRQGF